MKKFIAGFVLAAVLFNIVPIGAAIEEFVLNKADYKLIIKGTEYKDPDKPMLNYQGTTYAPVRSLLTAAGLDVQWNSELEQAEVKPTNESGDVRLKTTPDGVEVYYFEGKHYVPWLFFNKVYESKGYQISRPPKGNEWNLYENGEILLEDLSTHMIYSITSIELNYYINNILPLIKQEN